MYAACDSKSFTNFLYHISMALVAKTRKNEFIASVNGICNKVL